MKSVFLVSKEECGSSDVIINILHALSLGNKKGMTSKKVKTSQALKSPPELETNSMRTYICDKSIYKKTAFMHFLVLSDQEKKPQN